MGDLKFDEIKVNTELAEEYLKTQNYEFRGTAGTSSDSFKEDAYKNKIYLPKTDISFPPDVRDVRFPDNRLLESLKKLERKLEENAELFAQLDYLIRGNSPNDVKKFDMKILLQFVQYYQAAISQGKGIIPWKCDIYISEDRPLLQLGVMLHLLWNDKNRYYMVADINVAAVSYLFTQLCNEVGLTNVYVTFSQETSTDSDDIQTGCIGVISATSDIDSAIDAFLSSSTKVNYPWKLRHVLVQESVYETFTSVMRWKCALNNKSYREIDDTIKSACSDTFLFEDNMFLLDFVGLKTPSNGIRVEAYRTVKELLGLLKKYDDMEYLSLWCSDISEANEIAYQIEKSVWINDFGHFDGPAILSLAIGLDNKAEYKKISNEKDEWQKKDLNERRKILCSLIDEPVVKEKYEETVADIKRKLFESNNAAKSVDIQNNRIYVCILKYSCRYHANSCLKELDKLLYACELRYRCNDDDDDDLINIFEKYGLPIYEILKCGNWTPTPIKFIITNFGTTFAN